MKNLALTLMLSLLSLVGFAAKPVDSLSARTIEFVQNLGQWDSNVLFATKVHGGSLFFERGAITVALLSPEQLNVFYQNKYYGLPQKPIDAAAYKMCFLGASSFGEWQPSNPQSHYYNYFIGHSVDHWVGHVPVYQLLRYNRLYDGIDMMLYQDGLSLKYEYVVSPSSDPSQIQVYYEGIQSIKVIDDHLVVTTSVSRVVEMSPMAYQIVNGDTIVVDCNYVLDKQTVSFRLGNYDKSLPLIIDPVVVFSSYSGSVSDNWGYTATYDSDGNLYGGGICFGIDYPTTTGAYQVDYAGGQTDISISKFNAIGNTLLYSTYIGGAALDVPHSLYVNDNDELYVMGTTGSADYPVTPSAYDTSFNGGSSKTISTSLTFQSGSDIVVSKLSADGSQLLASTFVGGTGNDGINIADGLRKNYADDNRGEILIDLNSNVYVVSSTLSSDFPATANAFDTTYHGQQDVCVFKMSQDLSQMIWSAMLGGSGNEAGYGMSLASDNSVYICGGTRSQDFPVTLNVYQDTLHGGTDGFLAHISADGRTLMQSTFLGKSYYDQCYLVKVNRLDCPHVFGQTNAMGDAWIWNAAYSVPNGGQFLTKLTPDLDTIVWSTAFGTGNGGPDISPTALMVDYCSNIYMSGWGGNTLNDFGGTSGLPITADASQSFTDGNDFYLVCISDDASQLKYASFFGGTSNPYATEHVDGGTSRFDRKGRIYQAVCAGCRGQSDFPTTPGAWSTENGSTNCNLGVIKMDFALPEVVADFSMPRTICAPDTVHFVDHSQTIGNSTNYHWDFGDGTTSTEPAPAHEYTRSGVYQVTLIVQDAGSCNFADTLTKPILVLTNQEYALPDISICEGDMVQIGLQPFANTNYHWLPGSGVTNDHISNPVVAPAQTTTYMLEVTFGACVDTLQQVVEVFPYPASLPSDTIICQGDSAMLYVTLDHPGEPCTIEWSLSPNFSSVFGYGQSRLFVKPTEATTYYVRVSDAHCTTEGAITVDVSDINIIAAQNLLICFEDGGTLSVIHDGGPDCQYHWTLGDGTEFSGDQPFVSPTASTTYSVTISNAYGCEAVATGTIVRRTGTFPDPLQAWCDLCDIRQMDTTTIFCTNYGSLYTYHWTPSDDVSNPNSPETQVWPLQATTYIVAVTDTFNCTLTAEVRISVVELTCQDPNVFIPNAFSPNGDGHNDVLYVRSAILGEFYFVVYNHWGEKVFETTDQQIGWDGTFKGQQCQNGVYDYYFKGVCINDEEYEKKGNVMLVR